jgi:polysaccharide deacetylase 2 family uncharacterized protein YibQ
VADRSFPPIAGFCSGRWRGVSFAILLTSLIFAAVACKKGQSTPPLKASQVHSVTREMLSAAASVVRESGHIESKLDFDGRRSGQVDRIRVTLTADTLESQNELLARLTQSLDHVATAHALTRDAAKGPESGNYLEYRRGGLPTQIVEIATRTSYTAAPPRETGSPRLAIILDDLGNDRAVAQAIFAMPYPLTISVLPNHPHSVDIAQEARRRGFQVMLHLPMESLRNEQPEAQELRPGMSAGDVNGLVADLLQAVPDVAGVNNHQGSQSTADAALMDELMPVLREHNLFYVDSRTTAATVAFDSAQRFGVRSGFRNVPFLDDVAEVSAVRNQLLLALRGAQRKGDAIAIGHPHAATLQALRDVLPEAKSQGVRLVFASEVVH